MGMKTAGSGGWNINILTAFRPVLPALLALMMIAMAMVAMTSAAQAQAPADPQGARAKLDTLRLEVQQIETTLGNRELGDAELQRLRQRVDPVLDGLRSATEEFTQRADQARLRLDQLGPKPDAKAPESADIATERLAREKAQAEADEPARLARALLLQVEQAVSTIADKRRALFARTLFEHGPSLLTPSLWAALLSSLPQDIRALNLLISDWLSSAASRVGDRGFFLSSCLSSQAFRCMWRGCGTCPRSWPIWVPTTRSRG